MISTNKLSKIFRVPQKAPGLKGALRSFVFREFVEKKALLNATLNIKSGEIVGLVGANGAGKTTLVKLLCGIIHPSEGEAKVLGFTPWERKNDFRRQISLIMGQKAQLWWDLPAADSFILLKGIYQISRNEFKARVDQLTDMLHVGSLMQTPIRRLSLGERMKMELIASLLHKPKVVFLDEPTIGLDITSQRIIREFILKYRAENDATIILTSHYMQDIEELCERIIVIREGALVYDGSIKEVVQKMQPYKTLTFRTDRPLQPTTIPAEVVGQEAGVVNVRVSRDNVQKYLASILQEYSIEDLSINEDDVTRSIESLMLSGKNL